MGLKKIKSKKKKTSKNATVMVFDPFAEEQFIPTSSVGFDVLLSETVEGIEVGSLVELNGDSGVGKSTSMFYMACNQARNSGVKVVYVDAEMGIKRSHIRINNAFDLFHPNTAELQEKYSEKLEEFLEYAFDGYSMVVLQLNSFTGLDAVTDAVYKWTDNHDEALVLVIDSLAFLNTTAELDAEQADKIQIGQKARAWRRWCVTNKINLTAHGITTWFINHLTAQGIGQNAFLTHEKPKDESAGGKISKYAPDVRILIKEGSKILDSNDNVIGNEAKVSTKKNRNNISHRQIIIPLLKGAGPDNARFLKQVLADNKVVKFGSWTTFDFPFLEEPVRTQGSEKALEWIREHVEEITAYLKEEGLLSLVDMGEVVKEDSDEDNAPPEIDPEDDDE